jgi:hypothetical protein
MTLQIASSKGNLLLETCVGQWSGIMRLAGSSRPGRTLLFLARS